jgi:SAM-dependent methyltransferase
MTTYVFASDAQKQRQRLAGIEDAADAGTRRLLDELGLTEGWRCVEAGAGGGSIARWLGDRVGPRGHVLALDLDPSVVDTGGRRNVTAVAHDVHDPLPASEIDLVHARLLLAHLARWDTVLGRLVDALRPGGVLLVEDYDWISWTPDPANAPDANALHRRVEAAVRTQLLAAGYDPDSGRSLLRRLEAAGLIDVRGEGRTHLDRGGSTHMRAHRLSREQLRDAVLAASSVTPEEFDRSLTLFDDPDFHVMCQTMVAASGRKAA